MKKLLIIGLLTGCALAPEKKPEAQATSIEIPKWVNAPYEACQEESELCATGEGNNAREADAQARLNLASIFEVKIQSDMTVSSAASSGSAWHANVREDVQQSIQESVHEILETVQVKKYFRKDQRTHALASLDRSKVSELLLGRLNKIDDELKQLWSNRQRTNFRMIMRLFLEREKLNERYSIVSGQGRPQPVRYEEIVRWRDTRMKSEPLVLRIGQAPDWMSQKIKELLTESGFKLVRGDASKVLSMNVDSIKEFLNVEGFEKYTFTLNITSFENGEKKKVLSASETVTGRSQSDALLKVKTYFNEYIEQNLSKLQLD
jgi:hypothetical protein